MASASQILTDAGEICPVCLDTFDDMVAVPLVLMCGDSVCRQCLVDCKSAGNHQCPLCRRADSRDIFSIPKNFSLIRSFTANRSSAEVSHYRGRAALVSDSSDDSILPSVLSPDYFGVRPNNSTPKRRLEAATSPPPPPHRPLSTSPDVMIELPSVLDGRQPTAEPRPNNDVMLSYPSESGLRIDLGESRRHYPVPERIGDEQQGPDRCHVYLFASMAGYPSEPGATNYQTVLVGGYVVRPCPGVGGRGVHVWARYPNGWYGLATLRLRSTYEVGGDVPISVEVSGFNNPEPTIEPDFGNHVTCFAVIPGTTACLIYNSLLRELFIWCTDTSERFSVAKLEDGTGNYQSSLSVEEICITETTSAVLVTQRSMGEFSVPPVYCDPAAWIQIPAHLAASWRAGLYDQRWSNLPETANLNFENGAATQHVMAAAWSESRSMGPVFSVARSVTKGAGRKIYWNHRYRVNNRDESSLEMAETRTPVVSIAIHRPSGSLVSMSHVRTIKPSPAAGAAGDGDPETASAAPPTPQWSRRFRIEPMGQTPPNWHSEMFYSTTNPVLGHSSMNFCLDDEGNIWISHGDGSVLSVIAPPRSSYSVDAMRSAAQARAAAAEAAK